MYKIDRKSKKHDKTLVDYVGDCLWIRANQTVYKISRIDRDKGTIRVMSHSSGIVHEISFRRVS